MGVRARRWQLWLITTFILTGIIGMITLFKAPESAEAVTIAGGAANQSVALPSRSATEQTTQATQLPAWTPTDDATSAKPSDHGSSTKNLPKVVAPAHPTTVATTAAVTTSRTQATQLPSTGVTSAQTTPATRATSVVAKTVTPPPAPTSSAPTTKPTTATPVTTTSKPVATTTTAKPTTPAPTATTAATTSRPKTYPPRCFRIFFWTFCR